MAAVTKVSMQVPQIAAKFGIEPKPAPRSRGGRSRPRAARSPAPSPRAPPRPVAPKGAPRIPPPPPLADTPVGTVAPTPAAEAAPVRRGRRRPSPRWSWPSRRSPEAAAADADGPVGAEVAAGRRGRGGRGRDPQPPTEVADPDAVTGEPEAPEVVRRGRRRPSRRRAARCTR